MKIQSDTDDLSPDQLIALLRKDVQRLRLDNDKQVQSALIKEGEIMHLQATISALRDEMEKMQFDKAEVEYKAVAKAE